MSIGHFRFQVTRLCQGPVPVLIMAIFLPSFMPCCRHLSYFFCFIFANIIFVQQVKCTGYKCYIVYLLFIKPFLSNNVFHVVGHVLAPVFNELLLRATLCVCTAFMNTCTYSKKNPFVSCTAVSQLENFCLDYE